VKKSETSAMTPFSQVGGGREILNVKIIQKVSELLRVRAFSLMDVK
jgi:hypothetical protein